MSSQWMPFALYGFNRFVDRPDRARALAGGTAALVMQNWSCGYYLIFFAPFVPLFVAAPHVDARARCATWRTWADLMARPRSATLALTLPFLFPYSAAQQAFGIERPFGEVVAVTPPTSGRTSPRRRT